MIDLSSPAVVAALQRQFSERVFRDGQRYQQEGHVRSLNRFPDGDVLCLSAQVSGTRAQPYDVEIDLVEQRGGKLVIQGDCSCPMVFNCKHVVASLLQAVAEETGDAAPGNAILPPETVSAAPRLAPEMQNWLQELEQAVAPVMPVDPDAYPSDEPQRLVYVLTFQRAHMETRLHLHVALVRLLKQGGYGKPQPHSLDTVAAADSPGRFIRPADILIARRIKLERPYPNYTTNGHFLDGAWAAELLPQILATGRCFWKEVERESKPLALGDARPGQPVWSIDERGRQRPSFAVTPPAQHVLPLSPPWYLDEANAQCGPLQTEMGDKVAAAWLSAPAVIPEQAVLLGDALAAQPVPVALPRPQSILVETINDVAPVPCLTLYSIAAASLLRSYYYGGRPGGEELEHVSLARLDFDYGGVRLPADVFERFTERYADGRLRRIQRWMQKEEAAFKELTKLDLVPAEEVFRGYDLSGHSRRVAFHSPEEWLEFTEVAVPKLRAKGWRVEMAPGFRHNVVTPDLWYTDAQPEGGNDWFGVELGVQVDGQKINLLPVLLNEIKVNPYAWSAEMLAEMPADAALSVPLPDGRMLSFPASRLRAMLGVVLELFDPHALDEGGRLKLSRLQAAEMSGAGNAAEWRWLGSHELSQLNAKLRDFTGIQTVPPSPNLKAVLRGYQQEGLNWLQFLRAYDLAGILADDMGLGKTVQALAHLLHEKESGRANLPSLVVAPTSLMTNWRQECERFAPGLRLLVQHGVERRHHFEKLQEFDLIITSYPLLPRDQAVLLEEDFHLVILDEAQYIKNPKTKFAQIVCQLKARHRLCLTGTPMENHLGELWSLFNFLMPGFLGDETRFRALFRTPIEKARSEDRRKLLARRVAPFLLRRRKEEVVKELPPKTEIVQNVELAGAQRDLYETIRLAMHAKVKEEVSRKGLSRAHIIILDALLKLRQVCCDPRLVKLDAAKQVHESAKLDLLMDLLPEMIEEGRRVLLFSQFTSMLALIEAKLDEEKIPYVLLTGDTRDRATPVDRFQNGEVPLFLISLKAGGTGLNLTAADTVIHYDPWWNPAVENQATDRAHRIGQDKKVFVYKLMTVGTVEEKISRLQERKRELVEGLLDQERSAGLRLEQADLDVLFAPLQ